MKLPLVIQGESERMQKKFARDVIDFCKNCWIRSIESGFFCKKINKLADRDRTKAGALKRYTELLSFDKNDIAKNLILIGGRMENSKEALGQVNEAVRNSKKEMEELFNKLVELDNEIAPMLVNQIKTVRDTRMTLDREVNTMLTALREIRKFFLENEYEQEVKRLREFMEICRELQKLQEDGILDAVSETIIKLSLGGGK